jgi:hypothetical protein
MRLLTPILPWLLLTGAACAADPWALCEPAIAAAEHAGKLPPRLLNAIALVESGRYHDTTKTVHPWPWTINAEGEGHYYASKADAIGAVRALQIRGVRSIDVGCMQVNLMHHPEAFGSLDEAFEPSVNAAYATQFLNRLHAPADDWSKAIGDYHSATPALGDPYRAMVILRWTGAHIAVASAVRPAMYRAFQAPATVYGAFAPASQVYGAFAAAGITRAPVRSPPRMLLASAQQPRTPGPNGKPGLTSSHP